MPLTRYLIRTECSLADPDLYRAADKDDPEALLEGVAMAGLVGVLRQLGDLAEFAAEIFHDLHEEVMATAARGHGLMVRVQQLEAEFPSIEKAFLSQTDHSIFFHNAGVDWHPNIRMDQNLVTGGDLPRFVMDSYEECRGPPRLFLLDKFDIAGAGACLKRYTDPSLFKMETASSEFAKLDVQRDKKIRKVKKKGSRWRNGETPDLLSTSHAKLHQLFLEERVQNGINDLAHHVKLKKRQLNGSQFDSKTGKSYMEKILTAPSPDRKVVCDTSVCLPPLNLTSENTCESGLEIVEISTVNPTNEPLHRKRSVFSSPDTHESELNLSMDELNEVTYEEILEVPDPDCGGEADKIPFIPHKGTNEKEFTVDRQSKTHGSMDGYHSDDVASEGDNYMDALTTMESEMETDSECRTKNNLVFLNIKKCGTDSDANEELQELQPQFSDSHSLGNSTSSDDGNSSFKKGRFSLSCSDSLSNLAKNNPSHGDEAAKAFPSTDSCAAETVGRSPDQLSLSGGVLRTKCHGIPSYRSELGEASCSSCLTDSNPMLTPLDLGESPKEIFLGESKLDDTSSECTGLSDTDGHDSKLGENLNININLLDVPSETKEVLPPIVYADSHIVDKLVNDESHIVDKLVDDENPNIFSDSLLYLSSISDQPPKRNTSNNIVSKIIQTDCAHDGALSIISPEDEQLHSSILPTLEACSQQEPKLPNRLPASVTCFPVDVKPDGMGFEVYATSAAGVNSENFTTVVDTPQPSSFFEQGGTEIMNDVLPLEPDAKVGFPYSNGERNREEVPCAVEDERIGESTCNVDRVESKDTPLEFPSDHSRSQSVVDLVCVDDTFTETVSVEAAAEFVVATAAPAPAPCAYGDDIGENVDGVICVSSDLIYSPSRNSIKSLEPLSRSEDSCPKELKIGEAISPDCHVASETPKDVNQLAAATVDLDFFLYNAVSNNYSTSELIDDPSNISLPRQIQENHCSDVSTSTIFSKPIGEHLETKSPGKSELVENVVDAMSLPYSTCSAVPLEQALELQANQSEVGGFHGDDSNSSTLNLKYVHKEYLYNTDPERSSVASKSSLEDLTNNHSTGSAVPLEQALELQENQSEVGGFHGDGSTSSTLNLGSVHKEYLNCTDPERSSVASKSSLEDLINNHSTPEPLQPAGDQKLESSEQMTEINSMSLNLQSAQREFLNNMYQETPSVASSISCLEDLANNPSTLEPLQLEAHQKLECSGQASDPSDFIIPNFNLHPEDSPVNLEEMPPLPPLPPVQWRIGKLQHASLPSEKLSDSHSMKFFSQMSSLTALSNTHIGLPETERGITQSQNPFLPSSTVEFEKSQHVFENSADNLVQPSPLPLQMPVMANKDICDFPSKESESQNPFLPSSTVEVEKFHYVFENSADNLVQPSPLPLQKPIMANKDICDFPSKESESPNAFLPLPASGNEWPQYGCGTSEKETPPVLLLNNLEPETSVENKKLQPTSQNSEGDSVNPLELFVPPPNIKADKSQDIQQALLTSEAETEWLSGTSLPEASEDDKPDGKPSMKLPRPRSPLIDAVAAHDKSKLKKVTERVRPPTEPKVDERNSLLEQIRTKSFNLKPAAVTRPSIQGPKTNLRVAAILEKANAIRQAWAGSDEDDDGDTWSDDS